jgi:hypothetical protein
VAESKGVIGSGIETTVGWAGGGERRTPGDEKILKE